VRHVLWLGRPARSLRSIAAARAERRPPRHAGRSAHRDRRNQAERAGTASIDQVDRTPFQCEQGLDVAYDSLAPSASGAPRRHATEQLQNSLSARTTKTNYVVAVLRTKPEAVGAAHNQPGTVRQRGGYGAPEIVKRLLAGEYATAGTSPVPTRIARVSRSLRPTSPGVGGARRGAMAMPGAFRAHR